MLRWLLAVSLLLACSNGEPELLVDVTSDLAAVSELTSVEVSLSRGTTLVTGVDYAFVPADDLTEGVRVAELRAPSDDYVLRVRAFDPVGDLIAEDARDVRLVSRFGVSVYIDGACVGVECPGAGDPRTFTACSAGRCVPPACVDDPALCDSDAGFDGGADVGVDAPVDAGIDVGPDVLVDTMVDIDASPTCTLPDIDGTYTIGSIPDVRLEDGVELVEGADIDRRVSDSSDELGCHVPDFDDPDGTPGIDNQLASLKPTLDGFVDVDEAFSLADVSFALRTEMEDEGCEVVVLTSGDTELRAVGSVRGGIVRAWFGPRSAIAFPSIDPMTPWTLRDVHLRYDLMARSAWVAGSLGIDDVVAGLVATSEDLPEDVIRSTLESVTDLDPSADGVCASLSAGAEAR